MLIRLPRVDGDPAACDWAMMVPTGAVALSRLICPISNPSRLSRDWASAGVRPSSSGTVEPAAGALPLVVMTTSMAVPGLTVLPRGGDCATIPPLGQAFEAR